MEFDLVRDYMRESFITANNADYTPAGVALAA